METLKSHSIIALNLQTVEDVEQVIRQCEELKKQMNGGSENKIQITGSMPVFGKRFGLKEPYLADGDDFNPFVAAKKH